jgi:hypothetical protein
MGAALVVVSTIILIGFLFNRFLNYKEKQNEKNNSSSTKS